MDPDSIDEEHWCKLYAEYLYLNKLEFNNMSVAFEAALIKVLSTLLGKTDGNNNTVDT